MQIQRSTDRYAGGSELEVASKNKALTFCATAALLAECADYGYGRYSAYASDYSPMFGPVVSSQAYYHPATATS